MLLKIFFKTLTFPAEKKLTNFKFHYLLQYLINQKRHWHAANKGMDSYR